MKLALENRKLKYVLPQRSSDRPDESVEVDKAKAVLDAVITPLAENPIITVKQRSVMVELWYLLLSCKSFLASVWSVIVNKSKLVSRDGTCLETQTNIYFSLHIDSFTITIRNGSNKPWNQVSLHLQISIQFILQMTGITHPYRISFWDHHHIHMLTNFRYLDLHYWYIIHYFHGDVELCHIFSNSLRYPFLDQCSHTICAPCMHPTLVHRSLMAMMLLALHCKAVEE